MFPDTLCEDPSTILLRNFVVMGRRHDQAPRILHSPSGIPNGWCHLLRSLSLGGDIGQWRPRTRMAGDTNELRTFCRWSVFQMVSVPRASVKWTKISKKQQTYETRSINDCTNAGPMKPVQLRWVKFPTHVGDGGS